MKGSNTRNLQRGLQCNQNPRNLFQEPVQLHGIEFVIMAKKHYDDCVFEFIAPEKSLEGKMFWNIPKSEIFASVEKWQNTLVGYVAGNRPFYVHLKTCVSKTWKVLALLRFTQERVIFFLQIW